jgi:hypothetical protein
MLLLRKLFRNLIPLVIVLFSVMLAGCSDDGSPTMSSGDQGELFNPERGFEIEPGREIPFLNDNYWESQNGPQTNPFLFGLVSRLIGILGGTVECGHHSYTVPAGALLRLTRMTMAYASRNTVAVDCGPSPLNFLLPVTLRLSYEGTQYDEIGAHPENLRIWYMRDDGTFEAVESAVNLGTKIVSAPVTHFSRYIIG